MGQVVSATVVFALRYSVGSWRRSGLVEARVASHRLRD